MYKNTIYFPFIANTSFDATSPKYLQYLPDKSYLKQALEIEQYCNHEKFKQAKQNPRNQNSIDICLNFMKKQTFSSYTSEM